MNSTVLIIIVLCLAALICYVNSLPAPFIWDDEVLIVRNHYIKNLKFIWPIFTTSHFQGGGEGGHFYRPLQIISYLFDYRLYKLKSQGYHFTSLIFHCLAAVACYLLIAKISNDNLIGFLSALFFVVHPVQAEAVTYIAGRADPQFVACVLFALLLFIKIPTVACARRYLYWLSASIFYIFALLSKESALIFFLLTLFYGFCFLRKKEIKTWLPIYLTFFLISAGYLLLRKLLPSLTQARSLSLVAQAEPLLRLLTIPKIWLTYLGLLVFPFYLHMERHFVFQSARDPYFLLGLFLLFLTLSFVKSNYRSWREGFFYSGWFVLTLIPVLNIVPLNATCAEHWLYLPSVGFWALVASIAVKLYRKTGSKRRRFSLIVMGCVFLVFFCTRTIMRNFQWRNPLKLYMHDLKHSQNSFLLHNNLGVMLYRMGQLELAGREFLVAVSISPRYATSRNNLAVVLENLGKTEEAIKEYRTSIALNNYVLAYGNLGRVYLRLKQPFKAHSVLEKGAALYPLDVDINYYLALVYFQEGKLIQARKRFELISQLAPHYKDIDTYLRQLPTISGTVPPN